MLTEPTRAELRQNWSKGHVWTFSIDGDKLVMNADEKGNHFHNDIPLDQIDPYESEEKFFLLHWPMNVVRLGVALALLGGYVCALYSFATMKLEWISLLVALVGLVAMSVALAIHFKKHRTLMRFYHRMSGMEVCAIFTDLPDVDSAKKFIEQFKKEIPPWSYTFGGPSRTESLARELKALHQLRKDNVLTVEEFQFKKNELLAAYFHHGREPKT